MWQAIQAGQGPYAINRQRLVVVGDSTGGNLAAALCLGLRDDGRLYAERLQAAGVNTLLYPGKGLVHGCLRARGQVAEVDQLYTHLLHYLRSEGLTQV